MPQKKQPPEPYVDPNSFIKGEHVTYLHRGSSRSKNIEIPALIVDIFPETFSILIDGQARPRFVNKKLNKLRKLV